MNYSYKRDSSKNNQSSKNETLKLKLDEIHKKGTQSSTKNNNLKHNIMNLDLAISLSEHPIQTFQTNLQHGECDFQRINEARKLASKKLKQAKMGMNVKISESSNIQHEDCAKLMNFVIGGYDNDFNQYLSLNEFNEKRNDFTVLNTIYKNNLNKWKIHQKKDRINKRQQINHELIDKRSLMQLMNLNQNSRNMTRTKFEELLKLNKMVE